ncbi:MAG: hypothetical protein PVF63_03815 [Gammaproteobacteria bacterium]
MSFRDELARRNVYRVGAAYLIVAWMTTQVVDVLGGPLHLPEWFDTVVVVFLAAGFPVALVLAWAFEVTPGGIRQTPRDPRDGSFAPSSGQRLNYLVTACLAVALILMAVDVYVLGGGPGDGASAQYDQQETNVSAAEPNVGLSAERPLFENSIAPASVVVLPFGNLSPDPDDQVFATGLYEEFLSAFSAMEGARVIGRETAERYAGDTRSITGIAADLCVATVLLGSVSYANDRIVVDMQLIDGASGQTVWTEQYNREFSEVFEIRSEVTRRMAQALGVELSPAVIARTARAASESPAAYVLYLRALAAFQSGFDLEALEFLNRALAVDPNMAAAFARKAEYYALSAAMRSTPAVAEIGTSAHELALQNAERALEIDGESGPAWRARAVVHQRQGRWQLARSEFERAYQLGRVDPHDYAAFLLHSGEAERALEYSTQAVQRNPGHAQAHYWHGYSLARNGRHYDALNALDTAAELAPGSFAVHQQRAAVLMELGDTVGAEQALRAGNQLLKEPRCLNCLARLAYLYAMLDEDERAGRLIAEYRTAAENRPGHITDEIWLALAVHDDEAALAAAAQLLERIQTGLGMHSTDPLRALMDNFPRNAVLEGSDFSLIRRRLLASLLR